MSLKQKIGKGIVGLALIVSTGCHFCVGTRAIRDDGTYVDRMYDLNAGRWYESTNDPMLERHLNKDQDKHEVIEITPKRYNGFFINRNGIK